MCHAASTWYVLLFWLYVSYFIIWPLSYLCNTCDAHGTNADIYTQHWLTVLSSVPGPFLSDFMWLLICLLLLLSCCSSDLDIVLRERLTLTDWELNVICEQNCQIWSINKRRRYRYLVSALVKFLWRGGKGGTYFGPLNGYLKLVLVGSISYYIVIRNTSYIDPSLSSVNCTDYDIRLHQPKGDLRNRGTVQICLNGVWGSICSGGIGYGASHLMCAQLGYQRQGNNVCHNFVFGRNCKLWTA